LSDYLDKIQKDLIEATPFCAVGKDKRERAIRWQQLTGGEECRTRDTQKGGAK